MLVVANIYYLFAGISEAMVRCGGGSIVTDNVCMLFFNPPNMVV